MNRFALVAAATLIGCPPNGPDGPLALGTWGGDNAGVIVTDTMAHVHIGCTLGDAPRPSLSNGTFQVKGTYDITAYPVSRGILHPAVYDGRVDGKTLTLTVTLTDTAVVLGPATVELGREPQMNPCPICRTPGDRSSIRALGPASPG